MQTKTATTPASTPGAYAAHAPANKAMPSGTTPANKSLTPPMPPGMPAGTVLATKSANKALPARAPATISDTSTDDELRREQKRAIFEGNKIIEDAALAGRDYTDEERDRLKGLLVLAGFLDDVREKQREQRKQQQQQKVTSNFTSPDELSQLMAGELPGGPESKGRRGAEWGKAVVRQSSDQFGRFKGLTPSGTVLVDVPAAEPVALGRPVTSLRSLIPAEPTSGVYAFLRQTIRTSAAAPVAPGALKPTSIYNFERVQDHARVIAHLSEPIPRQDLSDAPLLQSFIQSEMFFGLEQALEWQIINGTGSGESFTGLANTAGIQTVALVGETVHDLIVTLRRGLTRLDANGLTGTGWVLNPSDWENIETLATDDGSLILQGADQAVPIDRAARRLWGLPVVSTPSCPVGVAWVADFLGSTKLYVREEARLDWSENTWRPDALGTGQGASDFARNLIAFRAEGRFGFAVTRPSGVVKVSLTA